MAYRYSYNSTMDSDSRRSNRTKSEQYAAFCRAFHDILPNLRQYNFSSSMIVLETFYATGILSLILRFRYAHEGISLHTSNVWSTLHEVELTLCCFFFETRNMTLNDLCDDVYRANLPEYLKHTHFQDKEVASGLYRQSIFGPANLLPSDLRERSLGDSIRLLIKDLEFTYIIGN